MPTWTLSAGDPLSLTLAADIRQGPSDYIDDQIWELRLGGGEPSAVAVETTYGLRANRMRLFPRFLKSGTEWVDPAGFLIKPQITAFYPNYLAALFCPFEGLVVRAEYWVSEAHTITGRFNFSNPSILPQSFRFEWAALLSVRDQSGSLAPLKAGAVHMLAGEFNNLKPVVFLSGGAFPAGGPFPALALDLEIYPGSHQLFTWAASAECEQDQSIAALKRAVEKTWDAETARIELLDASQVVRIQTGLPDWDAALAFSQEAALKLFQHNPGFLPAPSFVLTRRPDQGFSASGTGRDYPSTWSGQTALDAWYMACCLPGAPEFLTGVVRNFLSVQNQDGCIDMKPGLAGQISRHKAQPLLASLALQLAPLTDPQDWYHEVYPPLLKFFQCWLNSDDTPPTWENLQQSGLEESPIFNRFSPDAKGLEPSHLISPALAAMLFEECQSLIVMAESLGEKDNLDLLHIAEARLQAVISETWDPSSGIFRYRDRQTHLSLPSASVTTFQGPGDYPSRRRFKQPRRLVARMETQVEHTSAGIITVFGYDPEGETSETLSPRNFAWLGNQGYAITEHTFLAIERVEARGLEEGDRVRIFTPDYSVEDCSLLLPLWAGVPHTDRAHQLVETTLLTRFWGTFGIPISPGAQDTISLPWNTLIGEGLLRYGYRTQAAELFTRLMNVVVSTLKNQQAFYQSYHATSGLPSGERNHLHGLLPVKWFLHLLGIQAITPNTILIDGFNPFSNAVTVQYRRVLLTCLSDRTEIRFTDGENVVIDRPGPHRVILS